MPQLTDNMFKVVIFGVLFLSLWAAFNALFIGDKIGSTTGLTLTEVINRSWEVFVQPELIILNTVIGMVGFVIGLVVLRELLPV